MAMLRDVGDVVGQVRCLVRLGVIAGAQKKPADERQFADESAQLFGTLVARECRAAMQRLRDQIGL